jgi:hypothetical protein
VLYTGITLESLVAVFFSTRTSLFPDSPAVITSRAWSITSASFIPTRQSLAKKKLKDGAEAKIRLIESMNPHWYDLAESWTDVYKPVAKDSASLHSGRDPSLG